MLRSVVVLRHASAGTRSSWERDDQFRPLDPLGQAQALALPARLAHLRIDEIWTSPLARCHHTVGPLAAERRVPVIPSGWLAPDADPFSVTHGLDTLVGAHAVLLCTHRETLTPLLDALGLTEPGQDGPPFTDLAKGAALVVDYGADGRLDAVTLIEAPPVEIELGSLAVSPGAVPS